MIEVEVRLEDGTQEFVDIVTATMWELEAQGVSIVEKSIDPTLLSYDYIDPTLLCSERGINIIGYFYSVDVDSLEQELLSAKVLYQDCCQDRVGALTVRARRVEEDEWIDSYKEHFVDIDYGRVVVVPEWSTNAYDKPTVRLQLATAFGTGHHETTAMCIEAIQDYLQPGQTVADIGCGSGVLGIVALRLGAERVVFVDIDSQATDVASYNCNINNFELQQRMEVGSIALSHMASKEIDVIPQFDIINTSFLNNVDSTFDLIVANLTSDILIQMSDHIWENIKSTTILVVSGIINQAVGLVLEHYKSIGWILVEHKIQGEWSCIIFRQDEIVLYRNNR